VIRAATLAAFCLGVPSFGHATVFEFARDGRVIVRDFSQPKAQAQSSRTTRIATSRAVYRDMAEQVALRHAGGAGPRRAGLDAITFARVFVELIRAESGFNPRALSPKGAQGLGQLMPGTARQLGVRDAWHPEDNLDGAARYLSAQLERFGDVSLALAAYNAGPHRVVQYGGVPPFRETRAYVARITAALGAMPKADPAFSPAGEVQPTLTTSNPRKDLSVWQY
jgi:soluble lytic murein transglycosylase-like protein